MVYSNIIKDKSLPSHNVFYMPPQIFPNQFLFFAASPSLDIVCNLETQERTYRQVVAIVWKKNGRTLLPWQRRISELAPIQTKAREGLPCSSLPCNDLLARSHLKNIPRKYGGAQCMYNVRDD